MTIDDTARALPIPLLGFGAALLFLGSVEAATLIAAALLAVFAGLAAFALRRSSDVRFHHDRRSVGPWVRALLGVPMKTGRTAGVLAAALFGGRSPALVLRPRFDPGGEQDPRDRARRATALLAASLAPDSFVVMLERGEQALLHAIVRQADDSDPEWLA